MEAETGVSPLQAKEHQVLAANPPKLEETEPPERTSSTNNLISDCWPLELQGDTCLSSLPPSLWSSRLPQEITTEAVLGFLEQARLIQYRFSQHQLFSSKQNHITACGYIFVCLLINIYTSLKWKPYENGQCWVLITSEEKKKKASSDQHKNSTVYNEYFLNERLNGLRVNQKRERHLQFFGLGLQKKHPSENKMKL